MTQPLITAIPPTNPPEPRPAPGCPHASTPGQANTAPPWPESHGVCVRPWPSGGPTRDRVDRGHRGACGARLARSASRAPNATGAADPADPEGWRPRRQPAVRPEAGRRRGAVPVRVRAHWNFERAERRTAVDVGQLPDLDQADNDWTKVHRRDRAPRTPHPEDRAGKPRATPHHKRRKTQPGPARLPVERADRGTPHTAARYGKTYRAVLLVSGDPRLLRAGLHTSIRRGS